MAYLPVPNQSVSGTVGASIIGLAPVSVGNFPATQNVSGSVAAFQTGTRITSISGVINTSGSVAAWLMSTNASVITVGSSAPANQSVSGTVNVGNLPTTQNVSGSVVAWLGSTNASVITVGTAVPNQSVSGAVGANQTGAWRVSVVSSTPSSMLVGASLIGLSPVSVSNFPTTQNVSGSVVATQGTNPWIITGSVQGTFSSGNSSVQVLNFPTTQNVSGSVSAWLMSTNASVITVGGSNPANQSVSGTVNVGNFPTTQNISGSVVAWLTSTNASVITVGTAAPNQSVSGTVEVNQIGTWKVSVISSTPSSMLVGASIIGLTPVSVTFPTNQNVSGSVVATQGTNPWIITGSVQGAFSPSGNQSVSGTVGASIIGLTPVSQGGTWIASVFGNMSVIGTVPVTQSTSPWIITGSVQGSFSPSGNQSVSGTVDTAQIGAWRVSVVSSTPSSMLVGASIIGLTPVNVTNTNLNVAGSVAAWLMSTNASVITVGGAAPANQSVSGTVNVGNLPTTQNVSGSVVATQGTDPWIITGSVQASLTPAANQSVSGTVDTAQTGAWRVSVVSSTPSSMLVGASIIGLTPVTISGTPNVNTAGSVVAFQGTSPWIITGSVQGSFSPSGNQSVSGTVDIGNFPTNQNVSGSVVAWLASTNASVITVGTAAPNQSVSGTVEANQIGAWRVSVVSSTPSSMLVGASIIGLTPVNVTNTTINVSGSVVASGFPTNQNVSGSVVAFVSGTVPVNTAGSVVAFQGTSPWVVQSIVGTYAEDATHTSADKGLFVLGVRNDAIASFVSANLEYTPRAVDSAGRTVIKPFAPEDGTIISYQGSVVSASVTLIQASAIGKRNYITDFLIANTGSVAQLVTFQGGDTSIVGFTIAPAGGGSNAIGMAIPLKSTASQDLAFKVTGTSSVVYMTVKGYQAP